MSINPKPEVVVRAAKHFQSNLKKLAKRYRNIRKDVSPLIENLQSGETPGDRVSGTGHVVYKTRLKNSDIQKGKSGGYRVIYLIQDNQIVVLLIIYSKSDTDDVSNSDVVSVIDSLEG